VVGRLLPIDAACALGLFISGSKQRAPLSRACRITQYAARLATDRIVRDAEASHMDVLLRQLRGLKRLLRRRGASPEPAEDLVQEAVLRLHAYTRQGGRVQNQEAFLTRTAINLSVDQHRHARLDSYESQPIEELELPDLEPAPDEVFAAEQRLMRMREALDRANPRTREVFFMHRLYGFSHAEIARRLRISVSAVEKHVASAVTILAIERQRE
jgi:RNA polymerase sigma-70 factor (ECF subfamily)